LVVGRLIARRSIARRSIARRLIARRESRHGHRRLGTESGELRPGRLGPTAAELARIAAPERRRGRPRPPTAAEVARCGARADPFLGRCSASEVPHSPRHAIERPVGGHRWTAHDVRQCPTGAPDVHRPSSRTGGNGARRRRHPLDAAAARRRPPSIDEVDPDAPRPAAALDQLIDLRFVWRDDRGQCSNHSGRRAWLPVLGAPGGRKANEVRA
jgi:hypothetical protein